ncbi:molybdenum cofactor guanylyltransferase [Clostridium sp. LIBA-8841]|uniref:molybdenum cofactor guanylyltransferase n=1 Tax=Clostridium sp. LIBA-8841 TaxID=2987530 RepID=UPI002AC75DAD|nr:molybdenum cofactor guanylyltransferase [Clostridium sp. LIBA-8841]MDZ5252724.1 molybdenum cofactor guanylyltransferase [Clostridium sp. LIBA-8841]
MIRKTAAILAGGKSSRMNYKNKAFLEYENNYFIERIINALSDYEEIIIISNSPEDYKGLGLKVIKDIYPSQGPLSGIHSALNYIKTDYCLVVACDMPFINKNVVNYLGSINDDYEVLIPKVEGKLQPLCAIYKKTCKELMERELLRNNNKLIKTCLNFNTKIIDDFSSLREINDKKEKNFYNINTVEEYEKLIENREE